MLSRLSISTHATHVGGDLERMVMDIKKAISIRTTRVGGDSKNAQRNQILPTAYLSTFTNLLRC